MTSFNGQAGHPALTASKARLEALERRTPPGYPLGYSLHIHKWVCQACGATGEQQTLWTITRAGSAGKAYHPSYPSETMYDLPVEFINKSAVTPRCQACIGLLHREPVPALPPIRANLKTAAEIFDLFAEAAEEGQGLTEGPGIGNGSEEERAANPKLVDPRHLKMLRDGPIGLAKKEEVVEIDLKALGLL